MTLFSRHTWLATTALLLAFGVADASARDTTPTKAVANSSAGSAAWLADVEGMASAEDNASRRAYLRQRLSGAGMEVTAQNFMHQQTQGENLIVAVSGPDSAPLLLIGAHSDRVSVGRGATDNGSGSAAVMALAERLQQRPLKHYRVKVAFWDLEEEGLLGSMAYIAQNSEKPALYVNFDVFGWGDSLWMMSPDNTHPLVAASHEAAQAHDLAMTAGEQYPPTDHLAFLKAKWPAVSYSLVGANEIPGILAAFSGKQPDAMPKVMEVIHSPNDTIEQVDAIAAARGVDAVEAALRAWDAEAK